MVGMMSVKAKYSTMLNPANPEIQRYELSILKELASRYPQLDGVILDRVRYDGIAADFSDMSRKLFEKHIVPHCSDFPVISLNGKRGRLESLSHPKARTITRGLNGEPE